MYNVIYLGIFRLTNIESRACYNIWYKWGGECCKRVLINRVIYPLFFYILLHFQQLYIFIYSFLGFCCNFSTLLPGYSVVDLFCSLMTNLSCLTVTFLSRNQFINLFRDIMAGFTVYRAANRNIDGVVVMK